MIRAHTPAALPRPRFRYSPAVEAGPWIIFSGMIALDAESGKLEGGGAGAETAKILANLRAALPALDLRPENLVSARIFTTRFEEFAAINTAWEAWLKDSTHPPARTSVGVSALPLGATVEIEFQFYREGYRE
jgi:2-iminobutanoate/2-iminopropanoate deaminase